MAADPLIEAEPAHGIVVAGGERSIASYVDAFSPSPEWDELVRWPPDVFAVANLVLDHTECYRFVVAPPPGRRWPTQPGWNERVRAAGRAWREEGAPPELVRRCWDVLTRHRDLPLSAIRSGEPWEPVDALLTLHALADEACSRIDTSCGDLDFEAAARRLLDAEGSLARLSPTRVRIVPKANFSPGGITVRSMSRYLALCYESVDVRWCGMEPGAPLDRREYRLLLVPWPLSVHARDFRPASATAIDNMDAERFGFFEFAPEQALDLALLDSVITPATAEHGGADAVVFPESALRPEEIPLVEPLVEEHGVRFLVAGVREAGSAAAFGRNYLHFGIRGPSGWSRCEQDKHHRWCLDERQLRQYHLTRSLDPRKLWWEAIDVRERALHVVHVGGGLTTAPLVCEDLSRLDEVADLVRRIGPGLVIALLLDGPQLSSRWPSRYASVIADDPGSAVLTLTAAGMAVRSRPPGARCSRVVAHWNSRPDGVRELELARGAAAILVSATVEPSTLWTADGRRHTDVPQLRLSEVSQLRARSPARARPRARLGR